MPSNRLLGRFKLGDVELIYQRDRSGGVSLTMCPLAAVAHMMEPREAIHGIAGIASIPANPIDSLAQVKILGEPYAGSFSQGHTMRQSPGLAQFALEDQRTAVLGEATTIATSLRHPSGYLLEHEVTHHRGDLAFTFRTSFTNASTEPVTLEMLSSFSLAGITPFHSADAPNRLRAHRFRSVWCAEARLETRSIEELHLERSWVGAGAFSERFGQVGSMPVRKWFPFVALEDTEAGVLWGAQLAWAGSWQMEIYRQHDKLAISGGLADREFGHWMKSIAPGETLEGPPAHVACMSGTLDDLCDALTGLQQCAADNVPAVERDLPIVFNEWATTWGEPQHDQVVAIADRLKTSSVRYLVIDAGWYKTDGQEWWAAQGDWQPNPRLFPDGLAATADAIRDRGLIPGLWFEMETVGSEATAFSMVDHLLAREGIPLTVGTRRFWDLNDPGARGYLAERVIGLLERCGFGYLKVDYNETLGIGCEHADSLGEGLRRQIYGIYWLFEKIRERLPDLVIENCSSGGHRLEPSMLARSSMSSFSDAHETLEIPIIAASLHRLILPRQSQIWAVLRKDDDEQRLEYSLIAGFLGRMCLSGDVLDLSSSQWALVCAAQEFYRLAAPIIKRGSSRHHGATGKSWRHPTGWQGVVRVSDNRRQALIICHTFAQAPEAIALPLPEGGWRLGSEFGATRVGLDGSTLRWTPCGEFAGKAVLLTAKT